MRGLSINQYFVHSLVKPFGSVHALPCHAYRVRVQATPPLPLGPSALCNPLKVQPELPFRALRLDPIQQGVGSIGVPSLILLTAS